MSDATVALCSEALRLLGEISISSFDEATPLAETAALLWPNVVSNLQTQYPWRFTLRRQQLSRLTSPPPTGWPYAYELPADLIALRAVTATNAPHDTPLSNWDRAGHMLLSDSDTVWAQYQIAVPVDRWPPYFRQLTKYALAAEFAVPVTDRTDLAEYWDRKAFGGPQEGRMGGLLREARRLDAQQQPAQPFETGLLVAARIGGL